MGSLPIRVLPLLVSEPRRVVPMPEELAVAVPSFLLLAPASSASFVWGFCAVRRQCLTNKTCPVCQGQAKPQVHCNNIALVHLDGVAHTKRVLSWLDNICTSNGALANNVQLVSLLEHDLKFNLTLVTNSNIALYVHVITCMQSHPIVHRTCCTAWLCMAIGCVLGELLFLLDILITSSASRAPAKFGNLIQI